MNSTLFNRPQICLFCRELLRCPNDLKFGPDITHQIIYYAKTHHSRESLFASSSFLPPLSSGTLLKQSCCSRPRPHPRLRAAHRGRPVFWSCIYAWFFERFHIKIPYAGLAICVFPGKTCRTIKMQRIKSEATTLKGSKSVLSLFGILSKFLDLLSLLDRQSQFVKERR